MSTTGGSYPLFPPSKLDQTQIFQGAYDEQAQRLRTNAIAQISNVSIHVDLDPAEDGVFVGDKVTGDALKVNPDGSITVNVANAKPMGTVYSEVVGIIAGITTIVSQITLTQDVLLQKIDFSGSNIAEYELAIDGNTEDKKRTYFGSSLNGSFDFNQGLPLQTGQIVTVYVIHNRPDVGDFNARLQFLED